MSDDIEIQKIIRRLTRRYNAPGHELVNDDGPAAVAIIEALVKQRDEAIGAFNNLAIESKALTYFNRAEKAEAEVERLKAAIYEALNNEEDRADYDCKCLDCQYTLTGVGETLRKALEVKP